MSIVLTKELLLLSIVTYLKIYLYNIKLICINVKEFN